MFCENCGNQLKENAQFCTKCGTRITSKNASADQGMIIPKQPRPERPAAQITMPGGFPSSGQNVSETPIAAPETGRGKKPGRGRKTLAVVLIAGLVVGITALILTVFSGSSDKRKLNPGDAAAGSPGKKIVFRGAQDIEFKNVSPDLQDEFRRAFDELPIKDRVLSMKIDYDTEGNRLTFSIALPDEGLELDYQEYNHMGQLLYEREGLPFYTRVKIYGTFFMAFCGSTPGSKSCNIINSVDQSYVFVFVRNKKNMFGVELAHNVTIQSGHFEYVTPFAVILDGAEYHVSPDIDEVYLTLPGTDPVSGEPSQDAPFLAFFGKKK